MSISMRVVFVCVCGFIGFFFFNLNSGIYYRMIFKFVFVDIVKKKILFDA